MSEEQAQAQNRLQELHTLEDQMRLTIFASTAALYSDCSSTRTSYSPRPSKEGSIFEAADNLANGWEVVSESTSSCKSVNPTKPTDEASFKTRIRKGWQTTMFARTLVPVYHNKMDKFTISSTKVTRTSTQLLQTA
jgi:hypothetical protein